MAAVIMLDFRYFEENPNKQGGMGGEFWKWLNPYLFFIIIPFYDYILNILFI